MKKQQSGAALVLSLLILTVLTVLGLSSMRSASMEELMTRNTRDYKIAFEAADSVLNDGTDWVLDQTAQPRECLALTDCSSAGKVYKQDLLGDLSKDSIDTSWWESSATEEFLSAGSKQIPEAKTDPRRAMEATFVRDSLRRGFGQPTGINVYRISGRGTGIKDTTKVLAQQTVVKRFN